MPTVFLAVLSPPNVQENWRVETGLRVFAVQQTYVIFYILVPDAPRHLASNTFKEHPSHDPTLQDLHDPCICIRGYRTH